MFLSLSSLHLLKVARTPLVLHASLISFLNLILRFLACLIVLVYEEVRPFGHLTFLFKIDLFSTQQLVALSVRVVLDGEQITKATVLTAQVRVFAVPKRTLGLPQVSRTRAAIGFLNMLRLDA